MIPEGPQVEIEGKSKYVSMCRKCFIESLNKVLDPDGDYKPALTEEQKKEINKIMVERAKQWQDSLDLNDVIC